MLKVEFQNLRILEGKKGFVFRYLEYSEVGS